MGDSSSENENYEVDHIKTIFSGYMEQEYGFNRGKEVYDDITENGFKVSFADEKHGLEFANPEHKDALSDMWFNPRGTTENEKKTAWFLEFGDNVPLGTAFTLIIQIEIDPDNKEVKGNGYYSYTITVSGTGVWEIPKNIGNPLGVTIGGIKLPQADSTATVDVQDHEGLNEGTGEGLFDGEGLTKVKIIRPKAISK